MGGELTRPVPQPTELTQPFWDACNAHRLIVQRCDDCRVYIFNPAPFCWHCLGERLTWVESSGRGSIVTFTTVWRPQTPAFDTPYVVAVVRLEEGYEMMTNIVGSDPESIDFDQRVQVRFVEAAPDVSLPCFEVVR